MLDTQSQSASIKEVDRPVVLSVEHVGKYFKLPTEQASGLKQAFINWTRGIKGYKEQHVLRDINFEVHQGDFFGIVGRNGSGKSTLLKLISGIYVPDSGTAGTSGFCEVIFADSGISASGIAFISWKFSGRIG